MTLLLARIALSALATTLAAIAAERALRDVGRQARAVWAAALLLSAITTVVLVTGGRLPLGVPSLVSSWLTPTPMQVGGASVLMPTAEPTIDPLGVGWLLASLALGALLGGALLRQHRRLRMEPVARVSGVDVVVTRTLGPAVYGFVHPRIVVPDWLLDRSEEERRLVVKHEAEHIAARDPLLAACGLLVVCLIPWNPFLWFQLQRLRLAIELDCDARVLRRGDARVYGRLLVDVADRLARGTPLATALAFPRNFLEWRIRMIVNRRTRPLRAAAWALGAGALVVAACADAGDPVAAEDPANVVIQQTEPIEFIATVDTSAATPGDGNVIMWRTPAPDGDYDPAEGDVLLHRRDISPTMAGTLVPFRAELDEDDRPRTIEIDEGIAPLERERVRELLRDEQFRRSEANPDAPVEGAVRLD